jgi:hypothetical protein
MQPMAYGTGRDVGARARAIPESLPHSNGANPIASIPRSFGRYTNKSNQARSLWLEWRFDVMRRRGEKKKVTRRNPSSFSKALGWVHCDRKKTYKSCFQFVISVRKENVQLQLLWNLRLNFFKEKSSFVIKCFYFFSFAPYCCCLLVRSIRQLNGNQSR